MRLALIKQKRFQLHNWFYCLSYGVYSLQKTLIYLHNDSLVLHNFPSFYNFYTDADILHTLPN